MPDRLAHRGVLLEHARRRCPGTRSASPSRRSRRAWRRARRAGRAAGERSSSAMPANLPTGAAYDRAMPSVSVTSPTAPLKADAVVVGVRPDGGRAGARARGRRRRRPRSAAGSATRCARSTPPASRTRCSRSRRSGRPTSPLVVATGLRRRPRLGRGAAARGRRGGAHADRPPAGAPGHRRARPARWPRARCSARTSSPRTSRRRPSAALRKITIAGAPADRAAVRRAAIVADAVAAGARPGQHPAQRPLPRDVRRPRGRARRRAGPGRRGARRPGAQARRLRRHPRRRAGQRAPAAPGADQLPAGRGRRARGAGGQGHHVRLRRTEPEDRRT